MTGRPPMCAKCDLHRVGMPGELCEQCFNKLTGKEMSIKRICVECEYEWYAHVTDYCPSCGLHYEGRTEETEGKAKRSQCGVRYDLIPGDAMKEVAKVFAEGAKRYGDRNWEKSRLTGEHGPVNHALKHILDYGSGIPDDESDDLKIHLSHAITNLLFELHYELNPEVSGNGLEE